jgi:hypothetical protein
VAVCVTPEQIDILVAKGASAEMIAELWKVEIASLAQAAEGRRAKDRDRQRRHRESRDVTVTNAASQSSPPEVSPKNNIQTPSSPPVDASEAEASSHQPRPWALPVGVSLQVWTDFLANRKRKRLGNTETAWKAFNDDLKRISAQTGIPPPKLIELCTAKGWGAIYDPRNENEQRTERMGRHQPSDGLSSTARAAISVFGH